MWLGLNLRCRRRGVHGGRSRGCGRDLELELGDRGHRAEDGLTALAEKSAQGRPCLLETHRFNFTGSGQELALAELDRLLGQALQRFPGLRFMSAAELAQHYRKREPAWIASNLGTRLAAWNQRMATVPRFAKLARWSGLGGVLALLAPTKGVAA